MRATLHGVLLAACLLAATSETRAYCLYNLMPDADVEAMLIAPGVPPTTRVYRERIPPGRESCCNPKNAECNPLRKGDAEIVSFEAKIARGPAPRPAELGCGIPITDPKMAPRLEARAPVRGGLRFEVNPGFDRARQAGPDNPPYVARSLSPENTILAVYACYPLVPN